MLESKTWGLGLRPRPQFNSHNHVKFLLAQVLVPAYLVGLLPDSTLALRDAKLFIGPSVSPCKTVQNCMYCLIHGCKPTFRVP